MNRTILAATLLAAVLLGIPASAAEESASPGLAAHYFTDPINWDGQWPERTSVPRAPAEDWTFTTYAYSRIEPLVNHLFVKRGWFSVRWKGILDITAKPAGALHTVGGDININPSNQEDNEFTLMLEDGSLLTRSDLTSRFTGYAGPARHVRVRPKGNGNQNGLLLDGRPLQLSNADACDIMADDMQVRLYNDLVNRQGRAMGKWWIHIEANHARVSVTGGAPAKNGAGSEPATREYVFEIIADDGCRLFIDGKPVINDWRACSEKAPDALRVAAPLSLAPGPHEVVVEYFQGMSLEQDDRDPISLYWSCASRGITREPIPPAAFSHTRAHAESFAR